MALEELPEALALAAAGDPSAVAFRTYNGEYGLVSECDWPNVAKRMFGHFHSGYFRLIGTCLHDWLMRPPPGFCVHHRNGLKADNRRRNLQVLGLDVHRSVHWRQAGGLRTGIVRKRGRWLGRWGHDGKWNTGGFRSWEVAACVRDDCLRQRALGAQSVFDGTILDRDVPALLAAQRGRAMGFTFVAGGDGEVHHLSGIARRGRLDFSVAVGSLAHGLLLVWSGNRNEWRKVPLAGLLWVRACGRRLRVTHLREGLLCRT